MPSAPHGVTHKPSLSQGLRNLLQIVARQQANDVLQHDNLQPWRDITPASEGGGSYLNEASIMEPKWQEDFYGDKYQRLLEIKEKYDARGLFYATTAVGSEEWEVRDGYQGVQTQNGRLCRVRGSTL